MNTKQIEHVIQQDPMTQKKFGGVFTENRLPYIIDFFPCGFIANTDPDTKPGQHWVAFYFTSPHQGEFFDSYGHPPQFYSPHFVNFLKRNSTNKTFNPKKLQSPFTAVCGEYCVFYIMHRARGVSMTSTVNLFSSDKQHNDHSVYEFVMKKMRQ